MYNAQCVCSAVEYMADLLADSDQTDGGLNLSAIRAIRMLRPLRAINRIASLRILVSILLEVPLSLLYSLSITFVLTGFRWSGPHCRTTIHY